MTIVCGDSHTSTHGAFGALAMGIGTSEVEHVLATQTLSLRPFKTMAINGRRRTALRRHQSQGPHPRDHHPDRHRRRSGIRPGVPRLAPSRALSMEAPNDHLQHVASRRGARAGMIAPDQTTYDYLQRASPTRLTGADWDRRRVEHWELPAHRSREPNVRRPRCGPRRHHVVPLRHLGDQPRAGRAPLSADRARPRTDVRRLASGDVGRKSASRTWI